jgi:glycosyltransferase involved in cell wall biosynthesis
VSSRRRLLVVSHPGIVPVNLSVYVPLVEWGWDLTVVVPDRWRHDYSARLIRPRPLVGLEGRLLPLPILRPGRPSRHAYLARVGSVIRRLRPDVAFLEEEYFSIPAAQWGVVAARMGVPFGVQAAENLDKPLSLPARAIRKWTLRYASFVAARSPAAARLAEQYGARGETALVPHAVPRWELPKRCPDRPFTVGFAGRLVPEKGLNDLLEAAGLLAAPFRLLLVGDGPLRAAIEGQSLQNGTVEVRTGVAHEEMRDAYAQMDILVLPSRTTPRWAEQFGRVLVEALWCGVPVVGSDSGEIPWVVETTLGGRVFPEGDVQALADAIEAFRRSPELREEHARQGRARVERLFSVAAVAATLDEVLQRAAHACPGLRPTR